MKHRYLLLLLLCCLGVNARAQDSLWVIEVRVDTLPEVRQWFSSLSGPTLSREDSVCILASQYLGIPYKYGACGPDGFDCSGFVKTVYQRLGIELPRTSSAMATVGDPVKKEELKAGDLVFFSYSSRSRKSIGHVGIVMDNSPEGLEFIHASRRGIVVDNLEQMGYYRSKYVKAVRIL